MLKNLSVDLRNEFKSLVDDYGINVLLIRNNSKTRCDCYNPLHRTGNSRCKICGGTGLISSIELIRSIHQNGAILRNYAKSTEVGTVSAGILELYFDYRSAPKIGDQILIVGYKDGIPVHVKQSAVISASRGVRCDSGRIEFYQTHAKISPEKKINNQKRLDMIPRSNKLLIMKGRRYRWPIKQT